MAPPLNFRFNVNQQSGSSYPPSLLKRESAGVDCMQRASFITSSMVWLARCKILVPLQLMGWSSALACSAIADLSVWHLTQASLCSLSLVPRRLLVSPMFACFSMGERVFDLNEHGPESRARPKHHFDVVVPARLSDPLTNACYIRQHHQRRLALSLCFFGVSFSRLAFLRCCSDEGCRVSI